MAAAPHLLRQHGVLLSKVVDDGLLFAVDSAGEHEEEEPSWWGELVHGASLSRRSGSDKPGSAEV